MLGKVESPVRTNGKSGPGTYHRVKNAVDRGTSDKNRYPRSGNFRRMNNLNEFQFGQLMAQFCVY